MTAHAKLSASGSGRWLNCPASVRLSEGIEETVSPHAIEGTVAHAVAEQLLRIGGNVPVTHPPGGFDPVNESFIQDYLDFVREREQSIKGDFATLIEAKVEYDRFVPEGFGTCDALILRDGVVDVIDFKFGKGHLVKAKDNTQLMLYALGAYQTYGLTWSINAFRLWIVQPRRDHIDGWAIDVSELLTWAHNFVAPAAKLALSPDAEAVPGEEQCRFCLARFQCKARADYFTCTAEEDFGLYPAPGMLTEAEFALAYKRLNAMKSWISDMEIHALRQLMRGESVAGFKLVEGQSRRKVKNPEELLHYITCDYVNFGIDIDKVAPRKLVGLTELYRIFGKDVLLNDFAEFIGKSKGKPTVVPISDPRPAMDVVKAAEEFDVV